MTPIQFIIMRTTEKEKRKESRKKPTILLPVLETRKIMYTFCCEGKRKIILIRGKDRLFSHEIAEFKEEGTTSNCLPLMKGNMQEGNNSDLLNLKLLRTSLAVAAAAKSSQSCPTLCDPIEAAQQAPLSLGFSRQEYWSGLPFPSPVHESEK